jgi:hypothetical protein
MRCIITGFNLCSFCAVGVALMRCIITRLHSCVALLLQECERVLLTEIDGKKVPGMLCV